MADLELMRLLQNGVDGWNQFRQEDPTAEIDLQGADLSRIRLEGVDLRGANLKQANLNEASISGDLSQADMTGASLIRSWLAAAGLVETTLKEADLRDANLAFTQVERANLQGANLSGANLFRANLLGSWLPGSILVGSNLREANLEGAEMTGASLGLADLSGASLEEAILQKASLKQARVEGSNLVGAQLDEADLRWAYFLKADLRHANLTGANLVGANLAGANLQGANLAAASLEAATLVSTNIEGANLRGCRVYGISAWDVRGVPANQTDLVITPYPDGSPVTVDNLLVAQFVYLLLDNTHVRNIIDTVTSKAVLILGRFTSERKLILDAIRQALRTRNYTPILFDFERPHGRDLTETITLLARMAKFVIADLTDPSSIPQELQAIVPQLPSVPLQPLLLASVDGPYAMFEHLQRFPWVLPIFRYSDEEDLIRNFDAEVVQVAEARAVELRSRAY